MQQTAGTSPEREDFDVVVVGGGPAGSTAAALTAMRGHRVLLLEKETFPRHQIGESLLPATIHGVCRLLGVTEELAAAGFTKKRGGTFRWGSSPEPWRFDFAISPRLAGPTSFAYQVERMKFDQILLENARTKGADVRENHTVLGVVETGDRITGVRYRGPDGVTREAAAKFVIDGSGNLSALHRSVSGTREYSEFFQNVAIYGYFEGGERLPAPNSGNIFSVAFDEGWFWYIPLRDDLTSVGAVVAKEFASKVQGDPENVLAHFIDRCPEVKRMLGDTPRITEGPYGKVRVRKDYSYLNTTFWKPGMVLVGDAACFVDPVFSSGVHLATYSALLAARSINSVLDGTVGEEQAFAEFEGRYRREYSLFYEFLISFYDMHVDESSYFWKAKKVTNTTDTEMEAFATLVGGVASGEQALTTMSAKQRIRETSETLETSVASLSEDGENRNPLFKSRIVGDVMREGSQVQARAMLGEDYEDEQPLFDGGLISTADGLSWEPPKSR
ncbi:tryptophan 7-halogenase [Kitasatospora sp. NBC_00085]|uniref:tryptophan 7-halogenase n=1 Tax=unclassified Kitasatospora TaxID=2633591 RepID=UPI003248063B